MKKYRWCVKSAPTFDLGVWQRPAIRLPWWMRPWCDVATEMSATKKLSGRDKQILKKSKSERERQREWVSGGKKKKKSSSSLRLQKSDLLARDIASANVFSARGREQNCRHLYSLSWFLAIICIIRGRSRKRRRKKKKKKIPKIRTPDYLARRSHFQWLCHVARLRGHNGHPTV